MRQAKQDLAFLNKPGTRFGTLRLTAEYQASVDAEEKYPRDPIRQGQIEKRFYLKYKAAVAKKYKISTKQVDEILLEAKDKGRSLPQV